MKLTNIRGFKSIEEFVSWKLERFGNEEKSFSSLFEYMFSESENTMAEISDGYRIRKLSYGEMRSDALKRASALSESLELTCGNTVGLYMDNSPEWISLFWAILICGCKPLLMNKRLQKEVLEGVLSEYNVQAVISDRDLFSVKTVLSSDISPDREEFDLSSAIFGDEVIFMSSGTTQNIKLCAYTAENFYYQLCNSADIVKNCPEISRHYEGELKQLTLLPFYHVFGFIAVYLWFGFFSRTFVFLKDMNPQTVQNTVKKHKVTHIFAVPLVWESVYKAALAAVKKRGERDYSKFLRAVKLSNSCKLGRRLVYRGLGEVRSRLFGDSIKFLISGGGHISPEAIEFFNGIGYHIANGYGMTEVGITSVEISSKAKTRNLGSVGAPFMHTRYSLNENGELLIKGRNMASRICQGENERITDLEQWFNSSDLARAEGGRYYILGRADDLIVSKTGENLNPLLIENAIKLPDAEAVCLFALNNEPILLIYSTVCYSSEKTKLLFENAKRAIAELGLEGTIHSIRITPDPLIGEGEFKISRKLTAQRYSNGEFNILNESTLKEKSEILLEGMAAEIRRIFAEVLKKDESEIHPDANFFSDLGGSSLDYFMLSDMLSDRFNTDIKLAAGKPLHTVNEICEFIKNI